MGSRKLGGSWWGGSKKFWKVQEVEGCHKSFKLTNPNEKERSRKFNPPPQKRGGVVKNNIFPGLYARTPVKVAMFSSTAGIFIRDLCNMTWNLQVHNQSYLSTGERKLLFFKLVLILQCCRASHKNLDGLIRWVVSHGNLEKMFPSNVLISLEAEKNPLSLIENPHISPFRKFFMTIQKSNFFRFV